VLELSPVGVLGAPPGVDDVASTPTSDGAGEGLRRVRRSFESSWLTPSSMRSV
jgi:hypothetical protein